MSDVSQETLSSEAIAMQVELRRYGRRKRVMHGRTLCSKCLTNPPQATHKYCKPCKRADNRARYAMKKAAMGNQHDTQA